MYKSKENNLIWETAMTGNAPGVNTPSTRSSMKPLDIVTTNIEGQEVKLFIVKMIDNVALVWPIDGANGIEDAEIFNVNNLTPTGETHTPKGWGGL